mgnify:CR=1 FL=1
MGPSVSMHAGFGRSHDGAEAADERNAARAERALLRANRGLSALERTLWPFAPADPRRIGVLREGMLGDVAVALPALDVVRRTFPGAELILLSSPGPRGAPGAADLLGPDGPFAVVQWHRDDLVGLRGKARLLARLRALRLDLVVVLPAALTSPRRAAQHALALFAAGVGAARGFRVANARWMRVDGPRAAHDRYNESGPARDMPQAQRLEHHVRAVLADLSFPAPPGPADGAQVLALSALERSNALQTARVMGLDPSKPLLVLVPGAKLELKRWPAERFVQIGARWRDAGGAVAVIGSQAEAPLAGAIADGIHAGSGDRHADGRSALALAGHLGVRGTAALLEHARACLSNDTGPAHVAALLGTPTVVLQAARDRRGAWDPSGPTRFAGIALRASVPCAPCFLDTCPVGRRCLLDLDVESTWSALVRVAGRPCAAPAPERERGPPAPFPRHGLTARRGR